MQVWSRLTEKCGLYRAKMKKVNGRSHYGPNPNDISPSGLRTMELKKKQGKDMYSCTKISVYLAGNEVHVNILELHYLKSDI